MKEWIANLTLQFTVWEEVTCPLLKNNRCSIYANRPCCCKRFPNHKGLGLCLSVDYCALKDAGSALNSESSAAICMACNAKCCRKILFPKGREYSEKNILDILNLTCKECNQT